MPVSPQKQTSPVIIVRIEHKALAVDDLSVLRDRDVDAGAALSIDQFDSLRQCVGIFPAVLHSFKAQGRSRPYGGLEGVVRASSLQIYE